MAVLAKEKLKTKFKRYVRKNFDLPFIIFHKLKKSKKIISREDLYKKNSATENIIKSDKLFTVSGQSLIEIDANIDKKINSVAGWIPFIKNKTSIVLYNFFSINYGIRKQVLLRISIIKRSDVVFQKKYIFPTNGIKEFEVKDLSNCDGNSVILELFHPNFGNNHGQSDGHLRFWGKYYDENNNYISTVHSMPFPKKINFARRQNYLRTYSHSFDQTKLLTVSHFEHQDFNTYVDSKKFFYGYNVLLDKSNNPKSIWHYHPERNDLIGFEKANISYQGFWCPYHEDLNIMIAIDNEELGINNRQKIDIFLIFDDVIIEKKEIEVDRIYKNYINKIFDHDIKRDFTIIAKLHQNKRGFLHVHFDSISSPGDQVHSDIINCEINDNIITYNRSAKKGNSRKFFHLHKYPNNDLCKNYLIVNLHPTQENLNSDLKIRVLTDNNNEFVYNFKLEKYQPVFSFEIETIFPNIFDKMSNNAIIQIESLDDNFMGSFMHYNKNTQTICVDHLTGG